MSVKILSPSQQLADHLRAELLSGRWENALPGTPALAAELGVDRKMVTAAFRILEKEGLTEGQGLGRKRRVRLSKKHTRQLRIHVLLYEKNDQHIFFINEILHRMKMAGHHVTISHKTLLEMGMDAGRVARHVSRTSADVWLVLAASQQVLEWFAGQDTPALAIFGRRRSVAIPSVGPDKEQAIRAAVRKLVKLGHRRIVYLVREERRKPGPGHVERCYLDELERHGISTSEYNLPDWRDNKASFQRCLDKLFKTNPPTAIILDESQFFVAVLLHLSDAGLVVPRDISLICSDAQALFDWCQPAVSHIRWDDQAVVKRVLSWVKQLACRGTVRKQAYNMDATFVEGDTIGPARKSP